MVIGQRIVAQRGAPKKKGGPRRPVLVAGFVTACSDHSA
jgi:hypothetical protein